MWRICLVIGAIMLITACSNKVQVRDLEGISTDTIVTPTPASTATISASATAEISQLSFPSSVSLDFTPLQMNALKSSQPNGEWIGIKEISFGTIEQEKVDLVIYQDTSKEKEANEPFHGMIRFRDTYFAIPNELMELPSIEGSTMYLLQHTFSDQNQGLLLLGSVELFANGPGSFVYIAYDRAKDQWLTFEAWGKPYLIDLDSDGVDEFVVRFEGLHMQFADISIYAWSNGKLSVSQSVKLAILGDKGSTYATLGEEKKLAVGDVFTQEEASYIYDQGKLLIEEE